MSSEKKNLAQALRQGKIGVGAMTMERETFKHAKHVDRMTAIVNTAQNMIDHAT